MVEAVAGRGAGIMGATVGLEVERPNEAALSSKIGEPDCCLATALGRYRSGAILGGVLERE